MTTWEKGLNERRRESTLKFVDYDDAREQREMEFRTSNIPTDKKGKFLRNPDVASPSKPYKAKDLD